MRLHHVQVCCPPGGEEAAWSFYGGALGIPEVAKPFHTADGHGHRVEILAALTA